MSEIQIYSEFDYVLEESLSPEKTPSEEQKGEVTSSSAFSRAGAFCTSQVSV